jgi:hypothetical protein
MLFKQLLSLSLCFYVFSILAQVPNVELVQSAAADPFMPRKYYQTKWSDKECNKLRKESILPADFTGQFISLVKAEQRIIYHPIFSQFGELKIFLKKDLIHYGIATNFHSPKEFHSFVINIIEPRIREYEIHYLKKGLEAPDYLSYY